jgi:hypothetical protein
LNKREKRERKALTIENKRLRGDKNYKDDPTCVEAVQNVMKSKQNNKLSI